MKNTREVVMENKILRGAELKEFAKQFYTKVSTDLNSEMDKLGTASKVNTGLAEGNVPVLGAEGKLNPSVLPAIAVDTIITVENKDAALTAEVQNGDFVRITADAKVYMVIDDSKNTFEEKFVPLSSVTDGITRGEVQALLDEKVDVATYTTDKAELNSKIDTKVDSATYTQEKADLVSKIDAKVSQTDFEDEIDAINAEIAKKVSTETYVADKTALETSIAKKVEQTIYDAKVKEIEAALADKISKTEYTEDLAELNVKIDAKVAQTVYDAKVQELETAIGKKLDSETYTTDKATLEAKVADKGTELAVKDNALVLKKENGDVLSSVDFITVEDITSIIDAL